jgi:alpha-ketoglutarate-dependent taurine dioxygenase
MLSRTIADPRAWQADTLDEPAAWYHPLGQQSLSALDAALADWRGGPQPATDLRASDALREACAEDLRLVRAALEEGRGFAIITPGRADRFAPRDLPAVYWLVGHCLGRPLEQNVQGALLYDVRDAGQDVRYGARFSVTSAESTFHTDNSFGAEVLDYVGLLCLNTAKSGGESQVVSGHSVLDELRAEDADALEVLRRSFHFDRRGGVRPGEEPTVRFPIVAGDGPDLLIRYLRYWIEVGQEKAGQPLTAAQTKALDLLDRVAAQPRLRAEFMLRPGDMFFINNRWILHNRTAFEDHAEPERKRHYVRLWLRRAE